MDYTCDAVNNAFIAMEGFISPQIYSKTTPSQRPWFTSTPREAWQDGMGIIHNSILWERTVPTDDGTEWTDSVVSDGASEDQCTLIPEVVHFGQTERSMRVQRRNIQTEDFCVEDLRNDFQIQKTLEGVMRNLSFISVYVWETRLQSEYIRLSDHKLVEGATVDLASSAAFSASSLPTSTLTLGTLEQIYNWLRLDGAEMEGGVGNTGTGRPIFDLFSDDNTFRDLIRQDPEIRQDIRFAFMGKGIDSPSLKQLGSEFTFDGYRHVGIPWPQRYDVIGGVLTRVRPYKNPAAASKGVKQDINPNYLYAAYQVSVVHLPSVFSARIPKPITNPGGGLTFDPVNYLGDFNWLNIKDKKCNPRGQKGFFDAVFASASDPGLTHHGFAILHKNCPPIRNLRKSCYFQYTG